MCALQFTVTVLFPKDNDNMYELSQSKAFPSYPERNPYSISLGSHHKLKGNFHNAQSPWCPSNEGGCPQIPCNKILLRRHQPSIYKSKSDGIHTVNVKGVWGCCWLLLTLAIWDPAEVGVMLSGNMGQQAVLKFPAASGTTPIARGFTPGNFTNQIQVDFWELRPQQVWCDGYGPRKFCVCGAPSPVSTHGRHCQKGCDRGGSSESMDCSSSQIYCYSARGHRLVRRHAGAHSACSAVSCWRRECSACRWRLPAATTAQAAEWVGTTTMDLSCSCSHS